MRKFCFNYLIFLFPLLALTGCGDNGVAELKQWMDSVKKETHVVVAKVSEPKVYVPVAYSGKSELDPFNPAKLLVALARMKAESNNGLRPDMERRKEVLEAYPLDELRMVGVIERSTARNALIQVDKSVYQAKLGNYIGQNFGVITKINETNLEIKEIVQDPAGEWTERKVTLELQETKK
ncbi:MAG: pilus assembly protein PilP [Undibacterium sp.]|uniref:pilus assembly protein PilP n=1 Tax=Undibacterium sp. TaxID=1914977 RepID=UPI0027209DB9|nr:pilus assembly protein PilP [Undibacterium sp.]MDO8654501.1 pilus assembly protein PilP [Undibacterium sp.]